MNNPANSVFDRLVVSCCARPDWTLEKSLTAYAALGYRRLECFCDWVDAALDPAADPERYRSLAGEHGYSYYSLHLPHLDEADPAASLARSVAAARFAAALGMTVVYPRARSLGSLIRLGRPFLDAIEGLNLTACLEIHKSTPVCDIGSLQAVFEGIGDRRMTGTLEVGHLHKAGQTWRQAWEAFGDRLTVVHLKDIAGGEAVPLGAGECDLPGLLRCLSAANYGGDFVVELLLPEVRRAETQRHLREARDFFRQWFCDAEGRIPA
jgi:sugar phosphate isomerase/epimerase